MAPSSVAVTTGRIEVRDAGAASLMGFDGELALALARRAGGDVHLFEGLTVLELPTRRNGAASSAKSSRPNAPRSRCTTATGP